MTLTGRSAVVTGGGRGIGAAIAGALAEAGAAVVLASRTREEVEAVAGSLREEGHMVRAIPADVTDPGSVAELAATAGEVDILVNNAGIALSNPVHRTSLAEWNRALAVNATGTFLCTQSFLPGMLERGWGRVVNVASVAGLAGAPYISAYSASKHAAVGFTRSIAAEVAMKGVTVNAICPGYADTKMTEATIRRIADKTGMSPEEARDEIMRHTPQRRLIAPEEVAHIALTLCAEEARGITGQAIVIDGGGMLAP